VAQPDYVPLQDVDKVRPAERLPVPGRWRQDRPAEILGTRQPTGRRMGSPGPDQGYALKLAHRVAPRLELAPGESAEDAVVGCLGVGLKRASLFGRAPVVYDMELAYTLWGYLGGAPQDLIEYRVGLFRAASHDYQAQRDIVDKVRDDTLRLLPAQVRERLADWRSLLSP